MALVPKYLVVHTAAFRGANCDRAMIAGWHREKGWDDIGYHFVISNGDHPTLADGEIEIGRNTTTVGAHAFGINSRSLGICCIGHGDHDDFTPAQKDSLIALLSDLIDEHDGLLVDNVIGHREINDLVATGALRQEFRTDKTCPGRRVDMDALRGRVRDFRARPPEPLADTAVDVSDAEIRSAMELLTRAANRYPNARDELRQFMIHPEVRAITGGGSA